MKKRIAVGLGTVLVVLTAACSSLQAGQSPAPASPGQRVLVLSMTTAGGVHSIADSMLVPSSAALSLPPPLADGQSLNYAVADASGKILFEASVPNPLVVHAPLSPPGEPQKGHETAVLPQGEYVLRVPYQASAATLQVVIGARPVFAPAAAAGAGPPPPPGAQSFGLEPWLRSAEAKAAR